MRSRRIYSAITLEDSLTIFLNESDRACAILGSAHLEFLLRKAIEGRFVDDSKLIEKMFNGANAPLATFSSRIDMGYAVGIFGEKVRDELHIIRDIRNTFAHELEVHNFDSEQSTKDLSRNLKRAVAYANGLREPYKTRMLEARNLFIYTVITISDDLKVNAGILSSKPNRPLLYKSISKTIPGDHFYTISSEEQSKAIELYGYGLESIECYVYSNQVDGTLPLYRAYNRITGDHFYTTDLAEQSKAVNKFGYKAEKIACYVYKTPKSATVSFFRLYNPANGDHFYTVSKKERQDAILRYGYRAEGTECYVFESMQEGAVPFYRLLRTT